MSTAAAPTLAPARDTISDELTRDARAREASPRLETLRRRAYAVVSALVLIGIAALAAGEDHWSTISVSAVLVDISLFAALCRARFESGNVYGVPTQLALVPMLFAIPLRLVPAAVAIGFILGRGWQAVQRRDPARLLAQLTNSAHAFGPVVVLLVAHGLPLRWSAWPIYVAALLAQFAVDLATSILCELGNGISPREVTHYASLAYAVDAALAPVGLMIAFATQTHDELVLLVIPLVLMLRSFAQERKHRIDNALELSDAYRGTAFLLGDVVEADDAYTGSHSRHVVDLVLGVCDELGLSAADRRDAEFVALLHDVGKIKIPAEIINKPEPLSLEERKIIETHTIEGERLLDQVGGLLGHVGRLVRSCHERWDGAGYPDGLSGEEIPLVARIVCACDAYSAITTDRPYRAARTRGEAVEELARCAGTHFDPDVVEALIRVAGRTG